MKVRRNSWHFRLLQFTDDPLDRNNYLEWHEVPKSLCTYFWTIVLRVLVGLVILIPFLIVMGIVIGAMWIHEKYRSWRPRKEMTDTELLAELDAERERRRYKQEHPGLLRAFFRAHKEKVCPRIEVVDDAE